MIVLEYVQYNDYEDLTKKYLRKYIYMIVCAIWHILFMMIYIKLLVVKIR